MRFIEYLRYVVYSEDYSISPNITTQMDDTVPEWSIHYTCAYIDCVVQKPPISEEKECVALALG